MSPALSRTRAFGDTTDAETGTSDNRSVRFCAVMTISSSWGEVLPSGPGDWLCASTDAPQSATTADTNTADRPRI